MQELLQKYRDSATNLDGRIADKAEGTLGFDTKPVDDVVHSPLFWSYGRMCKLASRCLEALTLGPNRALAARGDRGASVNGPGARRP
eukprot:7887622-Prorocentrum_lima.AAC.1